MTDKNNNQIVAAKVFNKLEQEFLYQLAVEHGLKAWTKPNSHTRVYFKANRGEVESLLKKAEPAFQILAYRRHELTGEAMLYAGSKASAWPQVISQTQAKVSLFVQRNEHLDPVLKVVEKARAEVPPMMQFAAEVLQSLDDGYEEFVRSRQ